MMHLISVPASTSLLTEVASSAVRALVLAGVAGLGLAVFRVKAASLRLFTWNIVLCGALALPLLGRLLPPLPLPTPTFLRYEARPLAPSTPPLTHDASIGPKEEGKLITSSSLSQPQPHTAAPVIAAPTSASMLRSSPLWLWMPWSAAATAIYLAVALLLVVRFVIGLIVSHRLLQTSLPIDEPRVRLRLTVRAQASGLSLTPRAVESKSISVPVTMGALRSTILLPADWREWGDAKLDAVVAHELSHVVRRDALTQRLSLLHRAIFWFSPLAWWLDAHLADLAEQASDEAALSCGADRNDYAATLLGFFEALHVTPGRVWRHGVSMAKAGQAEQRVERILAWRGAVTMGLRKPVLRKSIAVAIIAFAVPVVYLAASARPASHDQVAQGVQTPPTPTVAPVAAAPTLEYAPASASDDQLQPPPAPASAPVLPPGPGAPLADVSIDGPPPVGPASPRDPLSPVSSEADQSVSFRRHSYAYDYDDDQRFVIVTGKSDSLTMSGSSEDARHAENLRKQIPGDFIWFQRDEKSYIIRDQATIDRARKLWAPQEELGKKQEVLGKQQEALGKQQQELGARMEKVRVNVPDLTAELDKVKAELKQLSSSGATVEQVGNLQSEIGELQSKIGEIQSHAGDQQSKLGEEMGALGEQQGKLGEQQGELGHLQGELAREASRQMKQLLDEAITKGTAQPEPHSGGSASL
jgi:beta-lactamase regulating signal transducer with metallopeptidase domain